MQMQGVLRTLVLVRNVSKQRRYNYQDLTALFGDLKQNELIFLVEKWGEN